MDDAFEQYAESLFWPRGADAGRVTRRGEGSRYSHHSDLAGSGTFDHNTRHHAPPPASARVRTLFGYSTIVMLALR